MCISLLFPCVSKYQAPTDERGEKTTRQKNQRAGKIILSAVFSKIPPNRRKFRKKPKKISVRLVFKRIRVGGTDRNRVYKFREASVN